MSDSYIVTVEKDNGSIFPAIIGFIVLIIIIAVACTFCNETGAPANPTTVPKPSHYGPQSTTIAQQRPDEPAYLAYLYVKDCNSKLLNNHIRDGVAVDPFGHEYIGRYFVLPSYYVSGGCLKSYTELVTDGKYERLSGSYFVDTEYNTTGVFQIYADGVLVYDSGKLSEDVGTVSFDICINNARTVKVLAVALNSESINHTIHVTLVNAVVYNP